MGLPKKTRWVFLGIYPSVWTLVFILINIDTIQYNIHCLRLCQYNAETNQVLGRCNEAEYAWHVVHTRAEHKCVICQQDSTQTLHENAPHIIQQTDKHLSTVVTRESNLSKGRHLKVADNRVIAAKLQNAKLLQVVSRFTHTDTYIYIYCNITRNAVLRQTEWRHDWQRQIMTVESKVSYYIIAGWPAV